eukprot:5882056-Alexandrium_andersonii.AAC.1
MPQGGGAAALGRRRTAGIASRSMADCSQRKRWGEKWACSCSDCARGTAPRGAPVCARVRAC